MRATLFAIALAVLVLALLPSQSTKAQGVQFLCYGQSFDSKVQVNGEDEFFWIAITSCPIVMREVGFLTGLYQFHWDDGLWYPVRIVGGKIEFLRDWAAGSGPQNVDSFQGANCYSAWTFHFGLSDIFDGSITASPGQCF